MTAQAQLFEGEARDPARSAWFTPPGTADRMVGWLKTHSQRPISVLEPSAGNGALIRALVRSELTVGFVQAFEPDRTQVDALHDALRALPYGWGLDQCDFLAAEPYPLDVALMNPPYERNQHVEHVSRALEWAARVVALVPTSILHSQGRAEFWRWTDVRRMAVLSARPRFGDIASGKQDIVCLELKRRKVARKQGAAHTVHLEWW